MNVYQQIMPDLVDLKAIGLCANVRCQKLKVLLDEIFKFFFVRWKVKLRRNLPKRLAVKDAPWFCIIKKLGDSILFWHSLCYAGFRLIELYAIFKKHLMSLNERREMCCVHLINKLLFTFDSKHKKKKNVRWCELSFDNWSFHKHRKIRNGISVAG